MKSTRIFVSLLAAMLLTSSATSLRADDWKTTDGKVYQDVKVVESKPDTVTILHHDGGASIPLANLPADLQKRFNYDPVKAKAAADARVKDDAANAHALQAEMNQASQMRQAGAEPQDTGATAANSSASNDRAAPSTRPASHDAGHYSMDDLSASTHSLKSDPSDSTHYSIDNVSATTHSLRKDSSDPTYTSMGYLFSTMHSLSSDLSDSTHHSIDDLSASVHSLKSDPSDSNHHSIGEIVDLGL